MTTRLLIIGQYSRPDSVLDPVADKVSRSVTTVIRRCSAPEEVVAIADEVRRGFGLIDVLDVFDHGRTGVQHLGGSVLFESDEHPHSSWRGSDIARRLVPYLAPTARLRLLGCDTAQLKVPRAGRYLLLKLAKALGGERFALGTIAEIDADDFDDDGFIQRKEVELMFSSYAALDRDVPCYDEHLLNLGKYWTEG